MNSNIHKKGRNVIFPLLAAALVAVFTVSVLIVNRNQRQKKEAEIVFIETRKAIELLSIHLDKGLEKMAHLNQFERTVQKIYIH
ncbi:hypothetical protein [Flagellimonas sp. 2504JD4-2]